MIPEDQKRLRDAFMDAVNRNPHADTPVEGHPDKTIRKIVENKISSGELYTEVEGLLAAHHLTLDQFIMGLSRGLGRAPAPPAKPTKPRKDFNL